jgi:hypothetical protein
MEQVPKVFLRGRSGEVPGTTEENLNVAGVILQ